MFSGFHSEKKHEEEYFDRDLTLVRAPALKLMLRTPADLKDIAHYGKFLLEGKGLLLALDQLEPEDQTRARDYLSGISYTLGVSETEVSPDVMLYLPSEVGIIEA
ncbi:cell division protein SepF [Acidaminococcus sp. NSJ-142]|jgi:FtsZ-interacting cell division protein YlmF|uniref:cell division protein SepF n=1 Tax=Acidaminococcus TaxID=904 RepID=UPI000CF8466A|nr:MULTISPECIES: cell division protein SepF [Acidaminococcus]MCD2434870.1 cell division protein SepF [Acidaminococcus hominis]MCH4095957.1 cell division protein SepF [Acidaminococcus provencensis]RHK02340.1 cell division protein SepF [Acidaminococcus sp. AM05-11]